MGPRDATAAALLAALVLSACTPGTPARRDLVIGVVGEPGSLLDDDPAARLIAGAVVEPLVRRNALEEFEPRLVVEVPTFENGGLRLVDDDPTAPTGRLVATFRLRDGLRWHDGRPLTSEDVRFAFDEDRSAPPGSEARALADRVERLETDDEQTFRVVYRAGERWENYPLAPRALPRHRLANASAQGRALYASRPVHAGPFRIAERVPGSHVTLVAFPEHGLGPPALGRIEVRFFSDRLAVLAALRRGDVDVAPSPVFEADLARTLDRFGDESGLLVYWTAGESLEVLRFGGRLAEPAVRQAVALAVDRERIGRSLFAGRARIPRTYLVPPLWAAAETGSLPRVDRDAARSLLADAHFRRGNFGILERDGARLIVTILVASGSPARLEVARAIAADLAVVGIAAAVSERARTELEATIARGDFQLAIVPERAQDAAAASERYRGLVDPWYDVLIAAAGAATDRVEKKALYAEAQRLWSEALPALPLHQQLRVDVAPARLDGVRPPPHDAPLTWNVREWRFRSGP